ncbi:MAG: hypothetical protein K6T59_01975 [Bryobacteraceae bacterium]|nr:hypothetical protein [Bryobacteraceae bacterium]
MNSPTGDGIRNVPTEWRFWSDDRQAVLLLARLLDTWELLPKAEAILKDAMLYLLGREGYQRSGGRRWRITEGDLLLASAITRPKDPNAGQKRPRSVDSRFVARWRDRASDRNPEGPDDAPTIRW